MKFYKRTRYPYWSNTKVFSWLLPERPKFTLKTSDDFSAFEKYIDNIPKLERFIDKLQDIVMFPSDLIYSVKIYFKNSKGNTHVLDGGLEKGQWYDLTGRIPLCLFNELEKFIEKEKGLEAHEWEKTLTFNEDWGVKPDEEKYGKLTHQALAAIEQGAIYQWWQENKERDYTSLEDEDRYNTKEEEILIRLIKIRGSLWT